MHKCVLFAIIMKMKREIFFKPQFLSEMQI
jgi:hypothetical protein